MNRIIMNGTVVEAPVFSHKCYGKRFVKFYLACERVSGAIDTVLCISREDYVLDEIAQKRVAILGEIRTRNERVNGKSSLVVYVYVKEPFSVADVDVKYNKANIDGTICKAPGHRITPLGRNIADVVIASNRPYNHGSDYIPCIAWGLNSIAVSNMPVGTKVNIVGRLQSREYEKMLEDGTQETRTAYELSISQIDIAEQEEQKDE